MCHQAENQNVNQNNFIYTFFMYYVIHYLCAFQLLQYDDTENVACVKDVVHPCLWRIILWEKSYRLCMFIDQNSERQKKEIK